ncbi:RNA polymerase II C-terminal domain phosphatase-like 4 [Lotus japonicus]|uniref:RNA polymerase II C-terminal domain phosphatase-like 4 n=1 Tax=Lotus japonicus TaxID=34305 RepID=UPI002584DB66|nr:RNA polymerase II C-terminal domain phosphatase-like 4 [Lotus japonicus]
MEMSLRLSEASVEDECTHPGSSEDMSIRCGQNLDGEYGVTFGYIHKGLRINDEEISTLRNTNMKNLLSRKKLYLVLDLDNTLLNSTFVFLLRSEELHLLTQTDSLDDVSNGSLFKFSNLPKLTKHQPFVRTFLKEVNKMFEMYIYTLGGREYARDVVKMLDPLGEYFNGKVISQADGTETEQKSLDVVPGHESAILILDDTKHVWMKHTDNLIQIEKYLFFAASCWAYRLERKSLAELKTDENETDGALARTLDVLKRVHSTFFDKLEGDLVDRDVRKVLKTVLSES